MKHFPPTMEKSNNKKNNRHSCNTLPLHDMDVFSDDENESTFSSTTFTTSTISTTLEPDIILHETCEKSRLANSMSVSSSDSEADFEGKTTQPLYKSSLLSQKKSQSQRKIKVKVRTPQKDRRNKRRTSLELSQLQKSETGSKKPLKPKQTTDKPLYSAETPKKIPKINIVSVEKVNIPVNSLAQKENSENAAQRKPRAARNIFDRITSTSKIINNKKHNELKLRTNSTNPESNKNTKTVSANNNHKETETQTSSESQKSSEIATTDSTRKTDKTVLSTSQNNDGQKNNETATQTDSKNQESCKNVKTISARKYSKMYKEMETQTSSESQESSKNDSTGRQISEEAIPRTSKNNNQKRKKSGTQMHSKSEESSEKATKNSKSVSTSTHNVPKHVEIQTDFDENNVDCENTTSRSKSVIKRPLHVYTQTEIDLTIDISSDEESEDEGTMKRKTVHIQVSPPKRLKTIEEECPILRLVEEHQKKLEAVKVNLTELFCGTVGKSRKTPKKFETSNAKTPNSAVKTISSRTPMKQLTITDLKFCKTKNTQSSNTTPNTSPEKIQNTTPNTSPIKSTPGSSSVKSNTAKKSPPKKETRYTKESHARVFENVKKIVQWVFENMQYSILFTKSETDLLQKLFDIRDTRLTILCIRLYTRQHKWYNLLNLCEELNLTDDLNLKEFYSTLTGGFVQSDYSGEKIEVLLDYLTLPDIKDICHSFKIRVVSKKQDLIKKLLDYSSKQCTLTSLKRADQILRDRVKEKLGICVKLEANVKDIFYRVHLLYSLTNPDLETPNDIYNLMYKIRSETIKFPKVKIDSPLLFSDRQDFLKFAEACVLRKEFYEQLTKKDNTSEHLLCIEAYKRLNNLLSNKEQLEFDKKKPMFLRRFSASWVYCKVLTSGSQNLGKHHPHDVCEWLTKMLEQEVYCIRSRGYWYSQLALVTKAHKKDVVGEAQTIVDGLSDKHVNEVQKHDLSIRGSKIRKGKITQMLHDELQCVLLPETTIPISRTIQANVVHNNEPGKKLRFVRNTAEGKEYGSVEETAINYYTTEDNYTHGIHCEGQLLEALFVILFWDILYEMHIPNTFITELQNRPLDLYSGEFYTNRQTKINERLKNIRDDWSVDNICEHASNTYSEHSLELKSIASFDFVEEGTFHIIIKSIGKKLLAAILERFAKDYKQFHSGLPDLFLWNHREFKSCFVEVKSENDRLSTKQILWINYLHKFGAKVEVCHVEHIGSRSTKKIKKQKEDE